MSFILTEITVRERNVLGIPLDTGIAINGYETKWECHVRMPNNVAV